MLKSPNTGSKTRLWIFYIFVILVHFLIIGRFFKIQIIDNEKYTKRAQSNYVRALTLPAPRGLILDRNGEIIVDNYPTYVLYAIEAEIKNKNNNYEIISRATGIDTSFLIKNFKNNFRSRFLPTRIAKDLSIEQLSKLEEDKNNLSGIIYEQFPERIYHDKVKATHALGYLKEVNQEMIDNLKKENIHNFYLFAINLKNRVERQKIFDQIKNHKKTIVLFISDSFDIVTINEIIEYFSDTNHYIIGVNIKDSENLLPGYKKINLKEFNDKTRHIFLMKKS